MNLRSTNGLKNYVQENIKKSGLNTNSTIDNRDQDTTEQLKQNIENLKAQNQQLLESLQAQGISESDIEKINDERNFIQKMLNLKPNTGVIMGALTLLGRPAEALQGALSANNLNEDPIKAAWNGLIGEKEYTLKDLGFNFENPLINAGANMMYEMVADPLNFMNIPFKALAGKATKGLDKVMDFVGQWASKSENGQQIYKAIQNGIEVVKTWGKKTFDLWKSALYKNYKYDFWNKFRIQIDEIHRGQRSLADLSRSLDNLANDMFSNWSNMSEAQRVQITDALELDDVFKQNIINTSDKAKNQLAFDQLKKGLNEYLTRSIEAYYKHGWTTYQAMTPLWDNTINGGQGILELGAKTIKDLKNGDAYQLLIRFVEFAKKGNVKFAGAKLEDLVKVEKVNRDLLFAGEKVVDVAGDAVSSVNNWTQGFTISLTDQGKQLMVPYFQKLNNDRLVNLFLDKASITGQKKFISEFVSKGEVNVSGNKEAFQFLEDIDNLYKKLTNKKLEWLIEKIPGGYKVRFAPNKESYNYIKSLDNAINSYSKRYNEVTTKLSTYNKYIRNIESNTNYINSLKEQFIINNSNGGNLDTIFRANKDILTKYGEEFYSQNIEFYQNFSQLRNQVSQEFPLITPPSQANQIGFERSSLAFEEVIRYNKDSYKATKSAPFKLVFDQANYNGAIQHIKVDWNWKRLPQEARVNVIAHYIERGILSTDDLVAQGIRSWKDLIDFDLEKLILKNNSVIINSSANDVPNLFNISEWFVDDIFLSQQEVAQIINTNLELILNGRLIQDATISKINDAFSQASLFRFIKNNDKEMLNLLSQESLDLVKNMDNAYGSYYRNLVNTQKFKATNDLDQLVNLEKTLATGKYDVDVSTKIGKQIEEIKLNEPENFLAKMDEMLENQIKQTNHLFERVAQAERTLNRLERSLTKNKKWKEIVQKLNLKSYDKLSYLDLQIFRESGFNKIYAYQNLSGKYVFSKTYIKGVDNISISPELKQSIMEYFEAKSKWETLAFDANNVNNYVVETQIAREFARNDIDRYSLEQLQKLRDDEFTRWNKEVSGELLANMKPKLKNKVLTDAIKAEQVKVKTTQAHLKSTNRFINDAQKKLSDAFYETQIDKGALQELDNVEKNIKQLEQQIRKQKKLVKVNKDNKELQTALDDLTKQLEVEKANWKEVNQRVVDGNNYNNTLRSRKRSIENAEEQIQFNTEKLEEALKKPNKKKVTFDNYHEDTSGTFKHIGEINGKEIFGDALKRVDYFNWTSPFYFHDKNQLQIIDEYVKKHFKGFEHQYTSNSSIYYKNTKTNELIRISDHWTGANGVDSIRSVYWELGGITSFDKNNLMIGKIKLDDFKNAQVGYYKNELNKRKRWIQQWKEELNNLKPSSVSFEDFVKQTNDEYISTIKERQSTLENNIKEYKNQQQALIDEKLRLQDRPIADSQVVDNFDDLVKEEVERLNYDIDDEIDYLREQIDELEYEQRLDWANTKYEKLQNKIERLEEQIEQYEEARKAVKQTAIENVRSRQVLDENMDAYVVEISQARAKEIDQQLSNLEKQIATEQKQIDLLNKELTKYQGKLNKKLRQEYSKWTQETIETRKKIVRQRQAELNDLINSKDLLSGRLDEYSLKLQELEAQQNVAWNEVQVDNFIDDVANNADNSNYVPVDVLSQADQVYKSNKYITPMLNDLAIVRDYLSTTKSIASVNSWKNAGKVLPEVYQSIVTRLVNQQMSIQGSISRIFKQNLGIDMEAWNTPGYLRHVLSPEYATLEAVKKTTNAQYSSATSEIFGKNMKKLAMLREYQASAVDVNKAFGTELFNTNAIEVTAMSLDVLPEQFRLAGAFKSIIENKLLVPVDLFSEWGLNQKGLENLINKVDADILKTYKLDVQDLTKLDQLITSSPDSKNFLQWNKLNDFQKKEVEKLFEIKEKVNTLQKLENEYASILDESILYQNELYNKQAGTQLQQLYTQRKQLQEQLNSMRQAGQNIDTTAIEKQIQDINDQINNIKTEINSNKKKIEQVDPKLEQRITALKQEIDQMYFDLKPQIAKNKFNESTWLKDNPQFGDEWMWVTKLEVNKMQEAFDLITKAHGDSLGKVTWGDEFEQIVREINSDNPRPFAIHKGVYESILSFSKRANSSEAKQIWSTLNHVFVAPFKKLATFSVGFYARNIFTNYINAFLAGLNVMDFHKEMSIVARELKVFDNILLEAEKLLQTGNYRSADEQLEMFQNLIKGNIKEVNGVPIKWDSSWEGIWNDYMEYLSKSILGNNQLGADTIDVLKTINTRIYGNGRFTAPSKFGLDKTLNAAKKISEKTFKMSKNMDDYAKVAMYRLLKSDKYKHLGEAFGMDAERFTKFVLMDYNALSPTEHNVLKNIFPFYTWARKNLEFQLRNFGVNNKKYRTLFKMLKGWRRGLTQMSDSDEETESEFMLNYIPIWNSDGKITYVKFDLPYQNVDQILNGSGIVNSLSPLIKTPLEMITGYDFYTGKNFNVSGALPSLGLGFSNMLFTFKKAVDTLFKNYKPTWEDKKVAGVLGKKILDLVSISKYAFNLIAGQNNDDMITSLGNFFPSVFSQSNINQTLYYNQKKRQQQLQAAQEYYLKNNK